MTALALLTTEIAFCRAPKRTCGFFKLGFVSVSVYNSMSRRPHAPFLFGFMYVCMSAFLYFCLFIGMYVCNSDYLFVYMLFCFCLFVCLSFFLSFSLCICLTICWSLCLFLRQVWSHPVVFVNHHISWLLCKSLFCVMSLYTANWIMLFMWELRGW